MAGVQRKMFTTCPCDEQDSIFCLCMRRSQILRTAALACASTLQCTGTDVQDPLAKKSPPDRKAGSGSANAPPTATGKTMRNKARCH
ncbi:uncharacterized protein LOC122626722 isoform X3 [Drosophila teissieri]|uniref:uncharacterized protein LOC122626722 isoform X3 n=1 Tax=Drosophila teissieri TaxID=7243 RepID=UPI001CBA1749|nr:uncharacterized protein LOC122626722 isoform X3 [Drosophila teissieri]